TLSLHDALPISPFKPPDRTLDLAPHRPREGAHPTTILASTRLVRVIRSAQFPRRGSGHSRLERLRHNRPHASRRPFARIPVGASLPRGGYERDRRRWHYSHR